MARCSKGCVAAARSHLPSRRRVDALHPIASRFSAGSSPRGCRNVHSDRGGRAHCIILRRTPRFLSQSVPSTGAQHCGGLSDVFGAAGGRVSDQHLPSVAVRGRWRNAVRRGHGFWAVRRRAHGRGPHRLRVRALFLSRSEPTHLGRSCSISTGWRRGWPGTTGVRH